MYEVLQSSFDAPTMPPEISSLINDSPQVATVCEIVDSVSKMLHRT